MISIIVPIYGIEKYLRECVDSLIMQTFQEIEIILVDDGSPDSCPKICDEYKNTDHRIKVIHKDNGGLVSARKAGALIAIGDYIVNVDGDDYIEKDLIWNINEVIFHNGFPDVIVYGFNKVEDNEQRNIITIKRLVEHEYCYRDNIDELLHRYMYDPNQPGLNDGYIPHTVCGKAVKRDLYNMCQDLVPDSVSKGEDTLFTLCLLKHTSSICLSNITGYNYRYRNQSMINTMNPDEFLRLDALMSGLKHIAGCDEVLQYHIRVYALKRIISLVTVAAKKASEYRDFSSYVLGTENVLCNIRNPEVIEITQTRFTEKLKMFLVQNKLWLPFYVLSRKCARNYLCKRISTR